MANKKPKNTNPSSVPNISKKSNFEQVLDKIDGNLEKEELAKQDFKNADYPFNSDYLVRVQEIKSQLNSNLERKDRVALEKELESLLK